MNATKPPTIITQYHVTVLVLLLLVSYPKVWPFYRNHSMSVTIPSLSPHRLESEYVHEVYDDIASHFSQTRYKPWPVIETFLSTLDPGSTVADVGCGNGKYLGVNPKLVMTGCDRSVELLRLCKSLHPASDLAMANCLSLPFRTGSFDHAISIAVIHHMSTDERRALAIKELLRIVKPHGKILIFVWAFEQGQDSKRKFDKQDVLVSWQKPRAKKSEQVAASPSAEHGADQADTSTVRQRYYHLFKQNELESLVATINERHGSLAKITDSGYDRDNWYIVLQKGEV
jgi:tRNA (uracil-5-)-methyltransferase TRM9